MTIVLILDIRILVLSAAKNLHSKFTNYRVAALLEKDFTVLIKRIHYIHIYSYLEFNFL